VGTACRSAANRPPARRSLLHTPSYSARDLLHSRINHSAFSPNEFSILSAPTELNSDSLPNSDSHFKLTCNYSRSTCTGTAPFPSRISGYRCRNGTKFEIGLGNSYCTGHGTGVHTWLQDENATYRTTPVSRTGGSGFSTGFSLCALCPCNSHNRCGCDQNNCEFSDM
jgi:hypothetical protein